MATCRAEPLTTGNISRRLAVVHKVYTFSIFATLSDGITRSLYYTQQTNRSLLQEFLPPDKLHA